MLKDWLDVALAVGIGVGVAALVGAAVHLVMRLASRRLAWAKALVTTARRPFWTLLLLCGLWGGASTSLDAHDWWPSVSHLFTLAAIATLAWLLIALVNYVAEIALGYNQIDVPNNVIARRLRTQTLIVRRLVTALVIVIAVGAALFTFDAVRAIGASILASAGIISVVAGLAAQTVLGNMFAGIQLVFSNALRVDDVIVAEGEWGRVGEITLSYVVLHLWDDRRLVLPCTYFTTTPYQNWTRQGSELLGSVELDLDWRVSPQRVREHLKDVLDQTPLFDGRASVLQVTDAYERHTQLLDAHEELRARDALKNQYLGNELAKALLKQDAPPVVAATAAQLALACYWSGRMLSTSPSELIPATRAAFRNTLAINAPTAEAHTPTSASLDR